MQLTFGRLTVMPAIVLLVTLAHAQEATEVFIPIGQSPGVSGITSVIGTVESCDWATGIVISTDKGRQTATLTDETKIYLDRSAAKKSGAEGSRSDCRKGRRVEVKYVYKGKARTATADWIKIQAE
jgi:hypothetical protein